LGTPAYMAPEQARGERALDARVDVFALGCVLFECIAGHSPFASEHVVAVLAKILFTEAPRLSEFAAVPAALDDLVHRMLEKDPDARPPHAGVVLEELRSLGPLDGSSTVARPSALTGGEQRVVCVVMTSPVGHVDET